MLLERDAILSELSAYASALQTGAGTIVIVSGEAGIGKTSVLRDFAGRASDKARVYWGGCEALFTPRTLGPLQDMAPRLGPAVQMHLENATAQEKLFPAVLSALDGPAKPAVMVIEDMHWADFATFDLIKYLGRRIAGLRLLLVLSLRSDEVSADHPLNQVLGDLPSQWTRRMELQPLSTRAVAQLAKQAGKPEDGLHSITSGNPFFVTELLMAPGTGNLPRSVRDAVWSRLSRLTAEERSFLEVLSIMPGNIDPWLVHKVCNGNSESLIDQCVNRGVLARAQNGGLLFRHELARLATLERLPPATQAQLHARIFEAIAAHDPDGKIISLPVRLHHAAGAGNSSAVLELAPKAARQAASMGAHREAARYFETALRHAANAGDQTAAELYEEWSYESGIALRIDEQIIDARQKAIALWRKLHRPDKVSMNLRWLSRLHWYRGESALAAKYIAEALQALEGEPPSAELAMAVSANSQMFMLNDRTDEAISWGKRAIALAEEFNVMETRIHALNNVGSAMLFSGDAAGKPYMEESLKLALQHGFHEQAARAFTNFSEYAVFAKEFELAERILADGIAFDTRHDLDAWTYYLVGRLAQLRMEQGRLREAETIARGALQIDGQTLVMKIPAASVLARACMRLGDPDADRLLHESLELGLATGEPQNIFPAHLALAEFNWLQGQTARAADHLNAIASSNAQRYSPWELGEFAVWWRRLDLPGMPEFRGTPIAEPRKLELDGDFEAAARHWQRLGLPYEAALSLSQATRPDAGNLLVEAISILEQLGAKPAAALTRARVESLGMAGYLPKRRRGPYKAARSHPMGLTSREVEVLGLIAKGLANGDIAKKLGRSQRTIEHHVGAVLGKLNAQNRMEVVLRLRGEPWLLSEK